MKHGVLSHGFIVLLTALAAACSSPESSVPTIPTSVQVPVSAPQPGNVVGIYAKPVSASQYPLSGYTVMSVLTLYDTGSFALDMTNGPYLGTYKRSGNNVTFDWQGWSTAGAWGATGTLSGDTLTIHYNLIMQLTDFEDATYTRIQ